MGSTSDLKTGAVIKYNGQNCVVLDYEHRTPGKGQACYQVKMRNMNTGKVAENRYRSGETIDFVRVERREYQYLYRDGETFYFMDMGSYEQIPVDVIMVGDAVNFMKENQDVLIAFEGDEILSVELPAHLNLVIAHTEPGLKGDTATNASKPAELETGATIQVPLFINEGDMIRIDAKAGTYIERVKA